MHRSRNPVLLLLFFAIALALWETTAMKPLRLLVVVMHETSHAAAALLSGGSVERIEVFADEGGVTYTRGGNSFLVLSAGYLGSMLWGAAILWIASRTDHDRLLAGALSVGLVLLTAIYVRNLFGVAFCLVVAAGLGAMARWLDAWIVDLAMRFVGLCSCLYVLIDIKSDLLDRSVAASDAEQLGQLTGLPGWAWGLLWIGAAAWLLWSTLKESAAEEPVRGTRS